MPAPRPAASDATPAAGLNYNLSGDPAGPAVLFLHGFMGRSEDWDGVSSWVSGRFLCVSPDLPGHGASLGMPAGCYTMEGTARAVLNLLDDLEVRRATVVGYSMGGRLALYLALHHPDRCAGLFLESASPGLEDAGGRRSRRKTDEEKAARLEDGDFHEFLRVWYRQPLFASLARDEGLYRRAIEDKMGNDPAELARSLRGMGTGSQPSLWGELPALRVPALAVAGELDEKFVGISRRMEAVCPRMRVAAVPGAGHNVRAERPAPYRALLEGLLGLP